MSTYSSKSLIQKLGLKSHLRVAMLRAPKGYIDSLELVEVPSIRLSGLFDFIQYFATSTEQLEAVLPNLKRHLKSDGCLWLCWISEISAKQTGLSESDIKRLATRMGLEDVKIASFPPDWRGLKFILKSAQK